MKKIMNIKKLKEAFTLAELMIVLAVIGILTAVLLPAARQMTPDENLVKFKKVHQELGVAIRELVTSDNYFMYGDLGKDRDGNLITNAKYFCNALADMLNVKSFKCSDNGKDIEPADPEGTLPAGALANLADSVSLDIDGNSIQDYVDCICDKNKDSGAEIVLNNDAVIYTVYPGYHFGKTIADGSGIQRRVFNVCSANKRYKYLCVDVDGIGVGEEPFGYALRVDGKLIPGTRASAWLNSSVNQENDKLSYVPISSCGAGTNITGENDSCDVSLEKVFSGQGFSCPNGQYVDTTTGDSCLECEAGYMCQNGVKQECAPGTYSAASAAACENCPAGYYCAGAADKVECSAGTYASEGASSCTVCAAGTYSAAGASSCSGCPAGYYCTDGTTIQCSAGTYAAAGASSCTACANGKYSAAGASSCSNCPAGYSCSGGAKTQCSAGTYAAAGASSCTACGSGKYSAAGASSCSTCASKTANCATCVASTGACKTCSSGYTLSGGACGADKLKFESNSVCTEVSTTNYHQKFLCKTSGTIKAKTTKNAMVYLIGGGGAGGACGSGGSSGQVYQSSSYTFTSGKSYTITIGTGGTGDNGSGNTGGNTTLASSGVTTLTANGGQGGSANAGKYSSYTYTYGRGGNYLCKVGGDGYSIDGKYYAGGGGGGCNQDQTNAAGGEGGGGKSGKGGANYTVTKGTAGSPNTGSGGGAGGLYVESTMIVVCGDGGSGGSGIVIILVEKPGSEGSTCDCAYGTCSSGSTTCSSCQAGYYLSSNECKKCPAGKYCTGGTAAAVNCATNYFSTGGASSCTSASSECGGIFASNKVCTEAAQDKYCKCKTCDPNYWLAEDGLCYSIY